MSLAPWSWSRLKKNEEPEPIEKKDEPEKNLPAPQPCIIVKSKLPPDIVKEVSAYAKQPITTEPKPCSFIITLTDNSTSNQDFKGLGTS